ncbi:unnamed protein product [Ambrosiozyma monospora]|uniref:Unnamed protein product n=1 Tax=Ambrosiozyma monospora TaxID=43982 RepID=A0ACB5T561_AMBMO|nr:unnamed protein product [Ambrosiozyma monospora]
MSPDPNINQNQTAGQPDEADHPTIRELWKLLENWLFENCPVTYDGLNPPFTPAELQEMENELGMPLAKDYKESLLVHNGCQHESLFGLFSLNDSEDVLISWRGNLLRDSDPLENDFPEVQNVDHCSRWIPIADNGCGQYYFIDLDPTEKGKVGQIHEFDYECGGVVKLLGKSFSEFFDNYVRDIYDGKYSDGGDGRLERVRY